MRKPIQFDFERIGSINDFYIVAKRELQLPEHFGNNLDALWDCITGDMELPAFIRFIKYVYSSIGNLLRNHEIV